MNDNTPQYLDPQSEELETPEQQTLSQEDAEEALEPLEALPANEPTMSQELIEVRARRTKLEHDDQGANSNIWESIASRSFDLELFSRHRNFLLYTGLLVLLSIMWSYRYAAQHRQIAELEVRVADMRNKSLFSTAERIRMERVASIKNQIEQLGLDLVPATRPPFVLSQEPESM